MNKIKLIILGLGALLLLWIASWFSVFRAINQNPATQNFPTSTHSSASSATESSQASVVVDFGDGRIIEVNTTIDKPTTAYNLLVKLATEKNLEIKTKQYDFGIFVESIDGYKSSSGKAWIYFVNGESGTVGADKKEITSSDKVEWKYVTPTGE